MKLKSYPKYKESGIDWIGEIPEGWEVNKVKHDVYALKKSGLEALEGNEEGEYLFFTSSQIQSKFIKKATFNNECLIMGTGGFASVHYHNGKFSASNDCLVLKKQKAINMKFLYYQILNSLQVIDDLGFWGTGLRHLQKYFFYNILACWPNKSDQTAIANFLDKKTSKIDALIEKDKKLIELLKERRASLINHAVTKGLDPNVKMKDSGIQWIGEIPEGWEVSRLKFTLLDMKNSIKTGPFGSQLTIDEMYNDEVKVYNQKNVIEKSELTGENYVSNEKFKDLIGFKVKKGDLLISTRGTIGKTLRLSEKAETGILHPCLMKINNNNKVVNDKFIEILIEESDITLTQLRLLSNATTIDVIYQDNLKEIQLILPPLFKQKQIVEYIDKATAKIDKTIKLIEKKITLLEEYKKSLIHHVVTGKVNVGGG